MQYFFIAWALSLCNSHFVDGNKDGADGQVRSGLN
jgi:hypothetical protein